MLVHALACDYDGTIADDGLVSETMARTLARVRGSERKLVLVTGRMLPDLHAVCPEVDAMFDAIVAENGALMYFPDRREVKILGSAPEPVLVAALQRRGVRFTLGSAIVATDERFAEAAVAAIREAGVERSLVFNKGSLMLLPGGVTKGTGLEAVLAALELSSHNTVGIGDGENDHAFLALCECAVAVADAVPALRARADVVTSEPAARGAGRFIEEHVLDDLKAIVPALTRHDLRIGEIAGREPVKIPAHGTCLLVVGPSSSGKSTLTGVLVERLVDAGRSLCLLDPEGDYQTLAELPGVVVLGGKSQAALPNAEELAQLLRRAKSGLVLDLSAMTRAEKATYATQALSTVAAVRGASGIPQWLIVDEAHHVFPAEGSSATELLRPGPEPVCLITLEVDNLAPEIQRLPNIVASTDLAAFDRALRRLMSRQSPPSVGGQPLARGEAALAWLDGDAPRAARVRIDRRKVEPSSTSAP
jgi:hydroxymethylpyrimidine pyrophosphatase-like HAD family hydrolase